jgi:putative copper resistance protein D
MLAVLVIQWIRQSEREARRVDRELDRAEARAARQAAVETPGGVRGANRQTGDGYHQRAATTWEPRQR